MARAGSVTARRDVASFDIFDTVLTRRVADPRSAFLLLGRRLVSKGEITCSSHAFARARTAAEQRVFANSGGLDSSVTLWDIYCDLANALHWSQAQTKRIYDEEIELEDDVLVVMNNGLRRVERARQRNQQVAFISDMYLPADVLERFLRDRGAMRNGDVLIVSNEYSASKATGALWPKALERLGVSASQVAHVGNDQRSDGRTAQRAGVRAEVLLQNNPNRYEIALESHAEETDGLSSALAGASRLARLDPPDPAHQDIADVSAGVIAPFVIGKLLWMLEVAKKEGLEKLFFVARDGQLFCDVARVLAPQVGYTGELSYIYGSRQAWALGGLRQVTSDSLRPILPEAGDVQATLRDALMRLQLTPEQVSVSLVQAGFHRNSWDRALSADDTTKFRYFLARDPDVRRAIRDASKLARELALAYFDQVGAITDQPIGFVDLGTGATLYNALSTMLSSVGQEPPLGFYFGLRRNVPDVGYGKPMAYVRDEDLGVGYLKTPGLLTLVELACTAPHGSVCGYEDVDGTVIPVLCPDGNQEVIDWGLELIHETVRRVANELLLSPDLVGVEGIDLRPAILEVFESFWESPTKAEAKAWGDYPFEDGWGAAAIRHPIAQSRGVLDAVRGAPHRHWWEGGSAQLSSPLARTAIDSRRAAKEILGKVRRRIG